MSRRSVDCSSWWAKLLMIGNYWLLKIGNYWIAEHGSLKSCWYLQGVSCHSMHVYILIDLCAMGEWWGYYSCKVRGQSKDRPSFYRDMLGHIALTWHHALSYFQQKWQTSCEYLVLANIFSPVLFVLWVLIHEISRHIGTFSLILHQSCDITFSSHVGC